MSYLIENEDQIYPELAELGAAMRRTMESAFSEEGINARCTGHGKEILRDSSLVMVHFPYRDDVELVAPDVLLDPSVCDVALSHQVLETALLLEDVHVIHGHGALCVAHTTHDMEFLGRACRRTARRIAQFLKS